MHMLRDENLLAALGSAVADRVVAATEEAAHLGSAAPAAIVALPHYAGCSIDELRRVVGLSHSGAVRLVDRLEEARLLERRPGPDARAVALHPTAEGRASARRILAARAAAMTEVLAPLDDGQRAALSELAGQLLGGVVTGRAAARHVCRLCDSDACGHPETCPVTHAADRAEASR